MPVLPEELRAHLADTRLEVLPEDYYLISLPPDGKVIPGEWYRPATTRFALFLREPKQISLVVARRKWLRMQNLFTSYEVTGPMKVLTFDKKISMRVCGYMSAIGNVLVEAKLCVIPVSTLNRDHILVKKGDLPRTVKVLRQFIEECKKTN
jgi:hypothetical protein